MNEKIYNFLKNKFKICLGDDNDRDFIEYRNDPMNDDDIYYHKDSDVYFYWSNEININMYIRRWKI